PRSSARRASAGTSATRAASPSPRHGLSPLPRRPLRYRPSFARPLRSRPPTPKGVPREHDGCNDPAANATESIMPRERHVEPPPSEITPLSAYLRRREFLALGAAGAGALLLGGRPAFAAAKEQHGAKLPNVKQSSFTVPDKKTPFQDITNY